MGNRGQTFTIAAAVLLTTPAAAQVDQTRAQTYFAEVAALCAKEGGRLWGKSLCGPLVLADAQTRTFATSQPAPDTARPAMLGFANTALNWGGTRWSTIVWRWIPADEQARARLFMHELFHRIQPELGLFVNEPNNEHLDTPEGRYWLQLEWRALARALGTAGPQRAAALADALAFRATRRQLFPAAAENERRLEINEGLAQYTGTVAGTASAAAATASAIQQLQEGSRNESFVRTFAYSSGSAYGVLLDDAAPGWTRRIKSADDLGLLLMTAAGLQPASNADAAARQYDGAELKIAEEKREVERQARLAELRKRFVDGPVLVIPRGPSASFTTDGMTPIPGAGLVYPTYRTNGEWGSLEGQQVLVSTDRNTLTVPAPASVEGTTLKGAGWTLTLNPGWIVQPGRRAGDYEVVPRRQ
jgi:hypothetical protein